MSQFNLIGYSNSGTIIFSDLYISDSAGITIPKGPENAKPTDVPAGTLRFNTTTSVLDYYSGTGWGPVSSPPPSILDVTPKSVPDNSNGTIDVSVNIIGTDFGTLTPSVFFIGSDNIERQAPSVSNLTPGESIRAVLPQSVFDNSNVEPFKVKILNSSSSLSNISSIPNVIDINALPYFITSSPFSDIHNNSSSASFPLNGELNIVAYDPEQDPLNFELSNLGILNGILTVATGTHNGNETTAVISGTIPNPGTQTVYSFNITAIDSAGNRKTKLYQFGFNVPPTFVTTSPLSSITNNSFSNNFSLNGELNIIATDTDGQTLAYVSNNIANIPGTAIMNNDGTVTGTITNPGADTTYNFDVTVTDVVGNFISSTFQFQFLMPQLITYNTTMTTSVTYLNSGSSISQEGSIAGGPVYGGWTIVAFTAGNNGTFSFNNYIGEVRFLIVGGGGPGGTDIGGGGGGGGVLDQKQNFSQQYNYSMTVASSTASTSGTASGSIRGASSSISGTGLVAPLTAGGGGGGGNEISGDATNMSGGDELAGGGGGGARKQSGGAGNSYDGGRGGNGGTNTTGGTGSHTGCGGGGGGLYLKLNNTPFLSNGADRGTNIKTGGNGKQSNIDGNLYYYGGAGGGTSFNDGARGGTGGKGGGGGGSGSNSGGSGGSGGRSARNDGSNGGSGFQGPGGAGGANTGGGGGGGTENRGRGGDGGSGIIIFRFPSYT